MFKETPGHVSLSVFRLYGNFENIWLKIYVEQGRMESLLTQYTFDAITAHNVIAPFTPLVCRKK